MQLNKPSNISYRNKIFTHPSGKPDIISVFVSDTIYLIKEITPWEKLPIETIGDSYLICYPLISSLPEIVKVYNCWEERGKFYIMLEYLEGYVTIDSIFCHLTLIQKQDIFTRIMLNLQDTIKRGVIQIDFSYYNYMINLKTNQIKLIDLDYLSTITKLSEYNKQEIGQYLISLLSR